MTSIVWQESPLFPNRWSLWDAERGLMAVVRREGGGWMWRIRDMQTLALGTEEYCRTLEIGQAMCETALGVTASAENRCRSTAA